MYYLDSVIFQIIIEMEPLVRKHYLLLTMIPQNSTPGRLYGQEIFSHLTRRLDGISQYVKSTGIMFVYKKN